MLVQQDQLIKRSTRTFDQIKLANEIADDEFSYTLVGNNCFSYQAQGKGYLLRIGDSIHYNGYKTVDCSCINYNEKCVCNVVKLQFTGTNLICYGCLEIIYFIYDFDC